MKESRVCLRCLSKQTLFTPMVEKELVRGVTLKPRNRTGGELNESQYQKTVMA